MAAMSEEWTLPSGNDLDLLIVGKTGNGKSATGNSILGMERFDVCWDVDARTAECDLGKNTIDGRTILVLDTPGLCDTRMTDRKSREQTMDALEEAVELCPDGFHAVLLVLKGGERMTKENVGAVRDLEGMLGGDVLEKHGVIVFTGGDSFHAQTKGKKTFETWCREQSGPMKEFLEACQYRCVLFNNVTEAKEILNRQRCELINLIDGMQSHGGRYTSEVFETAREEWRKASEKGNKPVEARKVYKEVSQIYGEVNTVTKDPQMDDKQAFEDMKSKVEQMAVMFGELEKELRETKETMPASKQIQRLRCEMTSLETSQDSDTKPDYLQQARKLFTSTLNEYILPPLKEEIRQQLPDAIKLAVRKLFETYVKSRLK